MRYHKLIHFRAEELLPPQLFRAYGSAALAVMDARILWTLDAIRNYFNFPIVVNNWHTGGKLTQRGFRDDVTVGAKLSQHRFGRAVDFDIAGVPAEAFRQKIKDGWMKPELQYITRVEDGVDWIHLDCSSQPGTEIIFFKGQA